jgi:hypothetical protein
MLQIFSENFGSSGKWIGFSQEFCLEQQANGL